MINQILHRLTGAAHTGRGRRRSASGRMARRQTGAGAGRGAMGALMGRLRRTR